LLRLGFIGAGRVATALSSGLAKSGFHVVAVASRSPSSAAALARKLPEAAICAGPQAVADLADATFITTPDDAVAAVCEGVSWLAGKMAVHCSGALSLGVLDAAARAGAVVGAMHPLQSFLLETAADRDLAGLTFAIEGDERALAVLGPMVEALGGHRLALGPGDKAAYHIGAVMASNYVVALLHMAAGMWETFGVGERQALRALMPLVRGTLANIERVGTVDALTGPIARGDADTVASHLAELGRLAPELLPAYRELGKLALRVAGAREPAGLAALRRVQELLRG
jgi:predicted short-subunit dehydrogenase-like oxidoreductase (DUF2520 family)